MVRLSRTLDGPHGPSVNTSRMRRSAAIGLITSNSSRAPRRIHQNAFESRVSSGRWRGDSQSSRPPPRLSNTTKPATTTVAPRTNGAAQARQWLRVCSCDTPPWTPRAEGGLPAGALSPRCSEGSRPQLLNPRRPVISVLGPTHRVLHVDTRVGHVTSARPTPPTLCRA